MSDFLTHVIVDAPSGGDMAVALRTPLYPPSFVAQLRREIAELQAALAQPAEPAADDVAEIVAEVAQATANWPPFNSAHEGFAVLKEEVDELWDEVKVNQKRRDLDKMKKEAKQVAAMALRFMRECCDETTGRK